MWSAEQRRIALFPGTFDPFTLGHQSLVKRVLTCADAVVISKADLVDVFDFKVAQVREDLAKLKTEIPLFLLSSKNVESLKEFCVFLKTKKEQNYVSSHTF